MSWRSLLKQPSAFVPLAMSLAALATVLGSLALFGNVRQPDEGTGAHIFQLLLAGQLPIVAWFAATWLPRAGVQALVVLALQAVAGLAALAPVFIFEL